MRTLQRTVGAMVVFPWQPRAQIIVAGASVLSYVAGMSAGVQSSASTGLELLGLTIVAGLTVSSVSAAAHYRRRVVQVASALLGTAWRA